MKFQEWKFFGRTCRDYIEKSDHQITKIYYFMSAQYDRMNNEKKDSRKKELLRIIKNNIEYGF